jgi:hypothetical protein
MLQRQSLLPLGSRVMRCVRRHAQPFYTDDVPRRMQANRVVLITLTTPALNAV